MSLSLKPLNLYGPASYKSTEYQFTNTAGVPLGMVARKVAFWAFDIDFDVTRVSGLRRNVLSTWQPLTRLVEIDQAFDNLYKQTLLTATGRGVID